MTLYAKSFNKPDEIERGPKTSTSIVKLKNATALKLVHEPGWKWSEDIKPVVGGHSCQAEHVGVVISGQLKCIHEDGSEIAVKPGDAYYFAPGHDAWVVGNEPCVMYEIVGMGK